MTLRTDNPSRAFLGVERSALGRRWRARLDGSGERLALAIAESHGLPEALARVVAARGAAIEDVPVFLEPTIRALMPDPLAPLDMGAAAERLARAVRRHEHVAIFGDYDVDGATSAAILACYLRSFGLGPSIHIPDRITEGYGPNIPAIRALADRGATLLVTVDCGTASHDAFAEAARLGLDVVVLDHHQAPADLPAVKALVNPNRQDDLSGLGHLAACGVVFLAVAALNRELRETGVDGAWSGAELLSLLDLVALGTVADVVPLAGLNRAFVRQGLKVMHRRDRPGLAALMDAAGLKEPAEPFHLGFLLGPRINAGGRIGDAALGARLLLSENQAESAAIAAELDRLNRERRTVEQAMVAEAEAEALAMLGPREDGRAVIVTGAAHWHPGVVGLVAARLKERFRRPAFAIAFDEAGVFGTGSARSIPGVDIGRAVRTAVERGIAVKGGGHAMAAGVTILREGHAAFETFIETLLAADVARATADDALAVDLAVAASGLTADLVTSLERAGPFGQAAPEPVLALPGHRLETVVPVGEDHLRYAFRGDDGGQVGGIAFRAAGRPLGEALLRLRGERVHAAGTLKLDRWGGRERVELRLIDLAPAGAS
jgi:single-stranded-DNA-specific exonuclease